MREILFRGKRKDFDNEWLEGFYTLYNDNRGMKPAIITGTEKHCFIPLEIVPETVGQYTGLTDENGKKIFEGDIMPVYEQGEEYYYKVIYNGDCFMLAMLDSEQGSYPLSVKHNISKVIGNIHDNPELLKGGGEG